MKYVLPVLASAVLAAAFPLSALAAPGDITAVRIEPNGWVAQIDIEGFAAGGTYDFGLNANGTPVAPKIAIRTVSQGFNAAGEPTTIERTVYGTQWIRKPYPHNTGSGPGTVKDESVTGGVLTIKVALSDFIYGSDTDVSATIAPGAYRDTAASGLVNAAANLAVAQTGTLPYPKVIGRWAWPGYERVTGDFPVEAAIFSRFPMDGKPVARVVFTATDQHGNSATAVSTATAPSPRAGDANLIQTYSAVMPTAGLTQGDVITINFRAYPWVGNAGSVLDSSIGADGVAQPSERLGPLYAVNDSGGSYGVGYALVSPAGATTTATVYASQAAAEAAGSATAFTTIGKAAEAIKAYQQANFGRANAGGGVILLAAGSYTFPGYQPASLGTSDTWLIVRPATGVDRAAATVTGNAKTLNIDKLKFESVTLSSPSTFAKGRPATDLLWLHGNHVSFPGGSGMISYRALFATQNDVASFGQGFKNYSSYPAPFPLVRGNTLATSVQGDLYAMLGNKNVRPRFAEAGNIAGHAISDNAIYAFNTNYGLTTRIGSLAVTTEVLAGMAIVENVMEKITGTEPLLQVAGDSSYAIANNVILWRNTMAGERTNIGYNEFGSVPYDRLNWRSAFNIFQSWNNKDDRFGNAQGAPDPARIGGWPVGYNVGSSGNILRNATFLPAFKGLSTLYPANPQYVLDASFAGTSAGNGNYQLAAGSPAIDIAGAAGAFDLLLPLDLLGNPISGAGIDAGAYEYQSGLPPADTTPPTLSGLLPTGTLPEGTTSATLAASTSENATCRYATTSGASYASMTAFASTGGTSHSTPIAGLTDGASYTYYLRCSDAAGNVSGENMVSFMVEAPSPADTTAPSVSITAPVQGSVVSGVVTVTATAADDTGVAGVRYVIDGAMVGELTAAPYSYAWNTDGVAAGTHTILAVARDAAMNMATSAPITVTIEEDEPTPGGDVTEGLVLRLTFDAADISGGVAGDVSGNDHDGALVGSPASVPGHAGEALSFDGTNYVDLGTGSFGLGSAYTISFWINQAANGATSYPVITARGQYTYPFSYQLFGSGVTNKWRITTRTSSVANLVPTMQVTKNQWYHVAVVQDGAARRVYVNGALIASDTLTGTIAWPQNHAWLIGKSVGGLGIVGSIDDYRVYNRALSAEEVAVIQSL